MTIEEIVDDYSNMLFKICLVLLCRETDAQDAVQDTFCRYLERDREFTDAEHEKAWLIRVAVNRCKDMIRFEKRHPIVDIAELTDYYATEQDGQILEKLFELPEKMKVTIYLFYIEGYHVEEIAKILHISENAVKKRLQRGRLQLKENLNGNWKGGLAE